MKQTNESRFYRSLENIFTGANIEGEGGYVNLLKIKSSYYKKILDIFKNEINGTDILKNESFREEFFERLYSFFEKYFSESGSVYFVKTANWQRVYEKVYTDNKDVVLFWKTHMLYYVKSDILFNSIDVEIEEEGVKNVHKFYFDVGLLKSKQNNEKKEIIFAYRETKDKKHFFDVGYSEKGSTTKIGDLVKKTKTHEDILKKAFATFKKQSEVDFFINKNAEKFLTEQLDLYLHQILLEEKNIFKQTRLDQLKTVKAFANKIIKFIAQFEDELVRIWNKPKFALDSNYVITLDKLSDELLIKISTHKNIKEQIKEWEELGMVEKGFNFEDIKGNGLFNVLDKQYQHLPIDTKYFKDIEIEILGLFNNLDEALDGRLIHSENYQALNTLQEKYKGKVQCIYIDPPFNTGKDFSYVDKFQDSTWLSIMNDRIKLAREFLREDGSFYLHLDENANELGKLLFKDIFNQNISSEIIWDRGFRGTESTGIFQHAHDTVFLIKISDDSIWNQPTQVYKDQNLGRYNKKDDAGRSYALIKRTRTDGTVYYGKTYPKEEGKSANDVISYVPTMASTNKQRWESFKTQKPEELIQIFVETASNRSDLIFDFFSGSGTTLATAHKCKRNWLGIEMGKHFENTILSRMKEVLANRGKHEPCGISKDVNWEGGGFFKYYSLEQYEDTLCNMTYDVEEQDIFNQKNSFEEYIFYADKKFAHVLELNKDNLTVDFDKLYKNIDFPETISNLLGLPIKKITDTEVILQEGNQERNINYDYKNMSNDEKLAFVRLLQPLLWWGK